MSLSKKLLSAIVSGSIACTAAAASFAMPAYADYYNTFSAVSKAKVPVTFYTSDASDEPFNVFDIYDARIVDGRTAVIAFSRRFGEGAEHIELRDSGRGLLQGGDAGKHLFA